MNEIRRAMGEPRSMTLAQAEEAGIMMEGVSPVDIKAIWVFGDCHYYEERPDGLFYCLVGNQDELDVDRTKVEDFLWNEWVKWEEPNLTPKVDMDGSRFNAGGMD